MALASIIDIVILVFLGITIFYAWRLSTYMRVFRDSRREMESLLKNLDGHIARAEKSVLGMRNAAESAGHDLQEIIKDSRFLADELNFMNEAGDSLANRLEKLAEKNRQLVEKLEAQGGTGPHTPYQPDLSEWSEQDSQGRAPRSYFSPRETQAANQSAVPELGSQAERDLYEALQRKRTGR